MAVHALALARVMPEGPINAQTLKKAYKNPSFSKAIDQVDAELEAKGIIVAIFDIDAVEAAAKKA